MSCILEEIWIVRSCLVRRRVPIYLCKRRCAGAVIINHVNYHGDASLVAFIDECLVLLPCAIGLVESEIMIRVVAPALVTVKLLDWHQFHCIDAESLQVIEFLHCTSNVMSLGKVSEKHFINYRALTVGEGKWLPRELISVDLHARNCSRAAIRILHLLLRIYSCIFIDPRIVVRVEYLFAERVRKTYYLVRIANN